VKSRTSVWFANKSGSPIVVKSTTTPLRKHLKSEQKGEKKKKGEKKEKGEKKKTTCLLTIEPDCELFHLRCRYGCPDHYFNLSNVHGGRAEYLWCRRRIRKLLGLLSISAPLEVKSFIEFNGAARSCGIVSNTNFAHLTLVEGYKRWKDDTDYVPWSQSTLCNVQALRSALVKYPVVEITSVREVPKLGASGSVLIVANVSLALDVEARGHLVSKCALPQFPPSSLRRVVIQEIWR
jgi:hypothetical protein